MTKRQIQDFRNGYSEGYREARHGGGRIVGILSLARIQAMLAFKGGRKGKGKKGEE